MGCGEVAQVVRCNNRLDGCTYAIKGSRNPVAGSSHERSALNGVHCTRTPSWEASVPRAILLGLGGKQLHIDTERVLHRGSRTALLQRHRAAVTLLFEAHIKRMILYVARGLR